MEDDRETRDRLRAYGAASAPDPARKDATWAAIAAATGAPKAGGGPTTSWLGKAGMVVSVIAALGGAAWVGLGGGRGDDLGDRPTSAATVPAAPTEPRAAPVAIDEAAPPEVIAPATVDVPVPPPVGSATSRERPRPAPDSVVPAPAPEIAGPAPAPIDVGHAEPVPAAEGTLAAELAVLRDAQRALRAGDAAAALRGLEDHRARFPDGALARDRDVARIGALCELDRDDEAQALAAFLGSDPAIVRALSRCVADP